MKLAVRYMTNKREQKLSSAGFLFEPDDEKGEDAKCIDAKALSLGVVFSILTFGIAASEQNHDASTAFMGMNGQTTIKNTCSVRKTPIAFYLYRNREFLRSNITNLHFLQVILKTLGPGESAIFLYNFLQFDQPHVHDPPPRWRPSHKTCTASLLASESFQRTSST